MLRDKAPPPPRSVTDFITDGSLMRLCEAASSLVGVRLELHDHVGRLVTPRETPGAFDLVEDEWFAGGEASPLSTPQRYVAPILVDQEAIGHIVAHFEGGVDEVRRKLIERLSGLLATTVAEVCERAVAQRQRAEELQALYRLSSMLVGAMSIDGMLSAGLGLAIETLGMDAGVVRLLSDEAETLELRASSGLDKDESRLFVDRDEYAAIDRAALAGEVVCVGSSGRRGAVDITPPLKEKGFVSLISTGLNFRGRAVGVLCLYAKSAREFSAAERGLLQSISQHLAAAVANARLLEVEAEAIRVNDQVRLAADVQRRMLPAAPPEHRRLDIAARFTPCFELGGDFYDFFDAGGGHVGFAVADVVGKGVAAALLMSHVRATLRAHALNVYDIDEVISHTNKALARDTLSNEFATLFYGVIDPVSLRLTYCNAGHEPPFIVHRPQGGEPSAACISVLDTGGMVLGVEEGQRYQRASCDLAPGDVLLAYTDGLAEAMNFDRERFGVQRIRRAVLDILTERPEASAKLIAHHVHWEMRRFAGLNRRFDDTTIVAIRVTE